MVVAEQHAGPLGCWIGCAGWSIPTEQRELCGGEGSHLERYGRCFDAVEINSSFYRPHRPATYARWAASVPDRFQFAVKVPRTITHTQRLRNSGAALAQFAGEVQALAPKCGPWLVQLPPSLVWDAEVVGRFLAALRDCYDGAVVCEPRHPSWFEPAADILLRTWQVARVAADPAPVPQAAEPGGWLGLVYYRWHGSPQMYYSAYSPAELQRLAQMLAHWSEQVPTWCIFDNTAAGAALANAQVVKDELAKARAGTHHE